MLETKEFMLFLRDNYEFSEPIYLVCVAQSNSAHAYINWMSQKQCELVSNILKQYEPQP